MKIIEETSLENFEFWSGAKDNAALLTSEELSQVEEVLEEFYPDGMTDAQINDLFWFEFDNVCESIGLEYDEQTDEIIRK